MKTTSLPPTLASGWNKPFTLGAVLLLLTFAQGAPAASSAEWLEQGIYTEETKGDLPAALLIYQRIVEDPGADRSLVAQAHLRLGLCQLKLGDKPRAISALDQLTREFPDKTKLLAIVEGQMPQLLEEIVGQIERNYIQEIDRGDLLETAIRAIVGRLDSQDGLFRTNEMEFLGAQELSQVQEQIEQKLAGIGAALKTNAGDVIVQSPLPGSPASQGGLRAGDHIVTINGSELPADNPLESAVKLLRGPVGTSVTVGIRRPGSKEVRELELVRDTVRLPSVLGDRRKPDNTWDFMLDEAGKIGYLRLTYIGKQSAAEMREALGNLQARGMRALILDLRNDPGGLLDGAVAVSDLFLAAGRIVTVTGRHGETVYEASPQGAHTGFPMAVLVNQKTASAAEIVAACLQDHQRAVMIGERTFGQGIVRSLFHLKNGVGAVKLPVAAYYRPSGKPMNRYPDSKPTDDWGVQPDPGYEIALTDEESKQYEQDRAARDAWNIEEPPPVEFQDRPLLKALEHVLAQLEQR